MEFALLLGPVYPPRTEMSSERAFELHMAFAERAHVSGWNGFGVNHHYLTGPEAQCFQPIPMCGMLLARYPTMYVATTIFVLPYHNPVEVAEQVATLDQMSPGKLILGLGKGYRDVEAQAAGIANADRPSRFVEAITAMKLLWAEGSSTLDGTHFRVTDGDIGVRPTNPNGPPLLLAADKVRTARMVPAIGGDHWLPSARHSHDFLRKAVPAYREALREAGREFHGMPIQRDVCVAGNERQASALIAKSYERMLHMQSGWNQPGENYNVPFEQLKENRVILGSPEQVAEELVALRTEYGAEFIFIRLYTPGMDPEAALEMTTVLGEEVFPLVHSELGHTSFFQREPVQLAG